VDGGEVVGEETVVYLKNTASSVENPPDVHKANIIQAKDVGNTFAST